MNDRVFVDFLNNYIDDLDNQSDKPKARFFKHYLERYLSENMGAMLDTPDIFAVLDKEFLLDCINFYILEMNPAKGVAEDYRRTILQLCKEVCSHYRINNTFIESAAEQEHFLVITAERFRNLKKSKNRERISPIELKILNDAIKNFLNDEDLEIKIKNSINTQKTKDNVYRSFVSIIALKLVREYGLSNKTIANLNLKDLNIDDKILIANGFNLYLNDDLIHDFKLYINSRELVTKHFHQNIDKLFITYDCKSYLNKNGDSENAKLFSFMKDTLDYAEVTGLRYNSIIDLVSRGADMYMLFQLTSVGTDIITRICSNSNKVDFEKIFNNNINTNELPVTGQSTSTGKNIGQIQCPYCGDYKDACSENWILIQISGEDKKHIACRECKGLDGKYRY